MEKSKKKFVLINSLIVILHLRLETILKVSMKGNIILYSRQRQYDISHFQY